MARLIIIIIIIIIIVVVIISIIIIAYLEMQYVVTSVPHFHHDVQWSDCDVRRGWGICP